MSEEEKKINKADIAVLEEVQKKLESTQKSLEALANNQKDADEKLESLQKHSDTNDEDIWKKVEKLSDLLNTNLIHIRAIVDNLSVLSERISYVERFKCIHQRDYEDAVAKLKSAEDGISSAIIHIDEIKNNITKELTVLKKVNEKHSKFHWKVGVIIAVGVTLFGIIANTDSFKEFLSYLLKFFVK